ncbi:MAG: lipid-A-disaccharide synthase [Thermogutta sp.]
MSRPLFISAGEPSGDQHGAALLKALRQLNPELRAIGFGGPRLHEAGSRLLADLTAHAVMWFSRPLSQLNRFVDFYRIAVKAFHQEHPQAVILIDYPGFHWHLARAAKKLAIPVIYYGPPQIWAWAPWRVKKLRRWVDQTFCWLPFEARWLQRHGCPATYVGHPFFDEAAAHHVDQSFLDRFRHARPLLTVLPGSRNQEVSANGVLMLRAVAHLREKLPELHVVVAAFRPEQANYMKTLADSMQLSVDVFAGKTPELIQAADCCLAVSGSVSLELLYYEKPTVIVYRIGRLAYQVQSWFRRVKYITLVNLLAYGGDDAADLSPSHQNSPKPEESLFPEFLTYRDCSQEIAVHLERWLTSKAAHNAVIEQLRQLKTGLMWEGAVERAAEAISSFVTSVPHLA